MDEVLARLALKMLGLQGEQTTGLEGWDGVQCSAVHQARVREGLRLRGCKRLGWAGLGRAVCG